MPKTDVHDPPDNNALPRRADRLVRSIRRSLKDACLESEVSGRAGRIVVRRASGPPFTFRPSLGRTSSQRIIAVIGNTIPSLIPIPERESARVSPDGVSALDGSRVSQVAAPRNDQAEMISDNDCSRAALWPIVPRVIITTCALLRRSSRIVIAPGAIDSRGSSVNSVVVALGLRLFIIAVAYRGNAFTQS